VQFVSTPAFVCNNGWCIENYKMPWTEVVDTGPRFCIKDRQNRVYDKATPTKS